MVRQGQTTAAATALFAAPLFNVLLSGGRGWISEMDSKRLGWWFQRFFSFHQLPGEDFQFDEHIFQMGGSTTWIFPNVQGLTLILATSNG